MNATELYHKDGKSTGVFYCSKCRLVRREQQHAEQCCGVRHCHTCPAEAADGRIYCAPCQLIHEMAREAARYDKAEKVTSWDGWVYREDCGYQDGYFNSVAEYLDWIAESDEEAADNGDTEPAMPDYVWTCSENRFCQLDYDSIIENATQDAYEDWNTEVNGADDLKAAIEKFNEANKELISYHPNYKRALILRPASYQPVFSLPAMTGGAL